MRKTAGADRPGQRMPGGIWRATALPTVLCRPITGSFVISSVSLLLQRISRGTRRRDRGATQSRRHATCRGTGSSSGTLGECCARAAAAAITVGGATQPQQRLRAGFEKSLRPPHVGARALTRAVTERADARSEGLRGLVGHVCWAPLPAAPPRAGRPREQPWPNILREKNAKNAKSIAPSLLTTFHECRC